MTNMVDLHTHILFGMDDGAQDLQESLDMIEAQIQQGVKSIVLTPHFDVYRDDFTSFIETREKNFKMLLHAVNERQWDVELLLGAELLFSQELLNLDLSLLVLGNTDYVLLEFPTRGYPNLLKQSMMQLLDRGFLPIFAHMERYEFLYSDLDLFYDLVNMGVLMQVNAGTFIHKRSENFIKACMKHECIHLIGSDTHNLNYRSPNIKEGIKSITKQYSQDRANLLLENASRIIKNQLIQTYPPTKIKRFLGMYI